TEEKLPLKKWVHLAASYNGTTGWLRLYCNGKKCAELKVPAAPLFESDKPVNIGQGEMMQATWMARVMHPAKYSIDGMVDELRLYNIALTDDQVIKSYRNVERHLGSITPPDLEPRKLPKRKNSGKFGATYTSLDFYDTWNGLFRFGAHPDVVVEFDKLPTSFIFWRGASYLPMMANEKNQWLTNEFNETWGRSGGWGCMEPMSDKEGFCNHAKILENTPARTVVQWRYPL
ncbi:MAG: LamG domain-containing protein, partial [bacterium]|nr:LamG domain-containing protein [bacterium]